MGNLNSWEFPARRFMDSSLLFILDSTFNIQHSTFNVIQWINDLFEQPGCLWLTLHSGRAGNLVNVPARLRTEYSQPSFWMTCTLSKILDMTVWPPVLAQCGLRHTAYTHKLDVSYGLVWSGRNTRSGRPSPSGLTTSSPAGTGWQVSQNFLTGAWGLWGLCVFCVFCQAEYWWHRLVTTAFPVSNTSQDSC